MPKPTAIQWSARATKKLVQLNVKNAAIASTWKTIMKNAVTQLSVESEYAVRTAARSVDKAAPENECGASNIAARNGWDCKTYVLNRSLNFATISRFCQTRQPGLQPKRDVGHHVRPDGVVQQVVEGALIELQRLVLRPGLVVEPPAAGGFRRPVRRPVQDQDRQRHLREGPRKALVGANHLGQGPRRLCLVRDERIGVHRRHHRGIAR